MELEALVDDIKRRDISDPSCMDKILIYLEQLRSEDEEFMQLLAVKVVHEEITWEQPWYQQGKSVIRILKDDGEFNNTYRKDPISKEESDQIKMNWNAFRKKYDMPDRLISFARWKNRDMKLIGNSPVENARRFLTAYLAKGLERTLSQVYKHVSTFFGRHTNRTYSKDELFIMEVCFLHYPTKAVTSLSTILGREPRGIYKQLNARNEGKLEKKKIKWTLPLASKLLNLLLKYTGLSLDELKGLAIEKSVWLKMEDEMEHHYVYLHKFWYTSLHVQLFVKCEVKLSKLKKIIFKILRDSDYKIWSDIRWKDLLQKFPDGFTHRFLYGICQRICRFYPKYLTAPLQEIAEYGLKSARKIRYQNRRLKTVKLNVDGNLEYVRYEENKE